jgi:very-short-patch-repair endonuclease
MRAGSSHDSIDQFTRDADRWAAIEDEGWILIRVLSHQASRGHSRVGGAPQLRPL